MLITRKSIVTGIERTRDIDITQAQLDEWRAGGLIQRVAPHLSEDDAEFVISGITPEEWDKVMGEEEE